MINKSETEKSLKRFLKKKFTFTVGVLVSFLITGAIGYASSVELASQADASKEVLLANIAAQKAEVQAQIDANNERLKELEKDHLNLVRKGDYYSKPVYPSTQIFFSYNYIDSGKMKNRTRKAWSDTIDIVKKNIEYKLSNGSDPSTISGVTAADIAKYQAGQMSLDDIAYNALYSGTNGTGIGVVTDGAPHSSQVDLGASVTPLNPDIPVIDRNVQVNVDVPGVPNVTVQAPALTPPTLTVPTIGAITLTAPSVPTVNLSVETPAAVAPITVAAANPTAPNAVTINAPTVSVSVTPPNIVPNTPIAPVVPTAPGTLAIAVTPTGPGTFTAPNPPASVSTPTPPAAAVPNVIVPPDIQYNAFGQTEYQAQAVGGAFGLWMNNNETINSNNAVIDIAGAGNAGSMTMTSGSITTNVGSIPTGTVYNSGSSSTAGAFGPRTIISTTSKTTGLAMNVDVSGNYAVNLNSTDACTYTFISLNTCWYGVGGVIKFAGDLTLNNTSPTGGGTLVGIRHQTNGRDIQSAGAMTMIDNGASITINGKYGIGALITTETSQETARTQFINNGTINVGGTSNIGIDYGVYDAFYPYVDVTAGSINVTGTSDYGIRIQNMSGYTPYYGAYHYEKYYEFVTIANGTITLTGNSNVGMSFAQKIGSSANVIAPVTGMSIIVDGTNNVGILRDKSYEATQTGDLIVDSTTITANGLRFNAAAQDGVLLRTDKFKSVLDTDITTNGGTSGNTAIQATNGSTAQLTSGHTLTVNGTPTTFTGMLASGASSNVTNNGTINITGSDSSGIAALSSGTAVNTGTITINGSNSAGVYNASTANITGTINSTGASSAAIYNDTAASSLTFNGTITASGNSASGIYNTATSGVNITGGTINITGTATHTATGIYNSGSMNATALAAINVNNNSVGAYNEGTITVDAGKINITGTGSSGVYAKAGNTNISGSALDAQGSSSTALVYEGGTLSPGSVKLIASGTGATGLYNLGTALTTTPKIEITHNNNTGLFNASGKTITATGDIDGGSYTGVAGIYNEGTLTDYTGTVTVEGGSSAGIYNKAGITDVSGTVKAKGTSGSITIGVYNTATGNITDISGDINADEYATAIYNAGAMAVSGNVTASGTFDSTGIYNTGAGTLTLSGSTVITVSGNSATGIYNDSTAGLTMNAGTVNVTGNKSAGIYQAGGTFTFNATVTTSGEEDAGVFTKANGGTFNMQGGSITATGINNKGSVGIYNQTGTNVITAGGTITATNEGSTGVYNEGTFTNSGTAISTTGKGTTGLYNNGTSATATITGGSITTTGEKASAVYDKSGTVNFNGNNTINANDGATGMYVSAGTVTTGGGAITTINVNNTLASGAPGYGEGVGVFASDDGTTGSTVDLTGSKIKVVGGSSAVASYGAGAGVGESNMNLTGATVDYSGDGFAVYSNGQYGKINMTNAQLHLRGNAYGVQMDYSSGTSPITFNATNIDVWDPTVTLASLKDYPTALNVSTMATSGIAGALGTGVTVNDHTGGTYKLAMIDGGIINIDENIDKALGAGTHSYDYFKRFQSVRMDTTVNSGIEAKAVLTTAQATADYNNQVIGIEASSSSNAISASETKVTMQGGSKITAARTDSPAGETGAVGVFINYGEVSVGSGAAIDVQQSYDGINQGVGVYAVNGSTVTNDGDINVAGKQAIGVLGMGYRELGGASQGAEWGALALNQGELHVTNNSKITLDGDSSIGMYAKNNTAGAVPNTAIELTNTSTGEVTVGNGTSSSDMAIGMYGDNATIKNSGKITTGDYGVGIYGSNGSIISGADTTDLGTITIGGNSVGIMGTGSTLASTVTGVNLVSTNTTDDKVGIMYDGTPSDIDFDIDGTNFAKGTVIYLKDPGAATFTYGTSAKTIKVGTSGVGIYINDAAGTGTADNKGTIDLLATSDNAVGMYTAGGTIKNSGTISINGTTGQVGMFASGALATADNTAGTIDLNVDNGTGIYIDNGATLVDPGTVNFGVGTKQGIGILLDGASMTVSAAGLAITSDNDNQNILIYAQDKAGVASNITNNGTITVDGVVLPASGSNKTVGVYLKDTAAQNTYQNGTVNVTNGAIGIYSSGDNIIQNATVNSTKTAVAGTVGIYIDGNSTLDTMTVNAQGAATGESVIGVYANGGVVNVLGGLNLTTGTGADYGTGMYLTGGATVAGTPISITNNSSVTNVGLYYTGTGAVAQGTDISLNGSNLVGIYADGGVTVNNPMAIAYNAAGTNFIGAYVTSGSTYNSSSAADDVTTSNSAAILVGNGTAVNAGTLTVSNGTSAAMAALAQGAADTAMADNQGSINVNAGAGMLSGELTGYVGTSNAKNSGTINVAAGGVGVAVKGTNGHFDGASGTINVAPSAPGATAAGIYLEETVAGQVNSASIGTLNIGDQGVGIYANKSVVDFPVTLGASSNGGVGVFATGVAGKPTTISGTIDASASQDTVGVYVNDENVAFNNATVTSGTVGTGTPIGVYLNNAIANYSVSGVTINANSAQSIGLYAGATTTELANTVNVSNGGLGVVVPAGTTLNTNNAVLNIDGIASIGIVLDGGTGNLGTTGSLAINFTNGGIGVFVRNGGVMNIGSLLTVTGVGSLAAAENASLSNSGILNVDGSTALFGTYTAAGTYSLENTSSGVINITGGGVGIAATGTPGIATVTVKNDGIINVSGKSATGDSSIGLYTNMAEIQNNNTINVGDDGIAIYADNSNNTVTNSDIKLNGTNATGIMISGAVGAINNTSITGTVNGTIGMYLDGATGSVNGGTITLMDDSVGIAASGATNATVDGNVTIGKSDSTSAVGLYAYNGANVTIGSGLSITGGEKAIAVAAEGTGTVINGVDTTNITLGVGGVYVYAGNGGTVGITGSGTLSVSDNVGVMINNSGSITGITSIDVANGGVGAYFIGASSPIPTINVNAGSAAKYSIGVYYSQMPAGVAITLPTINQNGDYTIGAVLDEGISASMANIELTNATAKNQVGVMAKGTAANPVTLSTGTVKTVGDENLGIYGEYADITSGDVTTDPSSYSADKGTASIGIYTKNGSTNAASVTAGANTIGVYADTVNANGVTAGNITVGDNAIGVYATGTGSETVTVNGDMAVANDGSVGVYTKDAGASVIAPTSVTIGYGTSAAVINEGSGDITYSADTIIADKGTATGSMAIYKKGSGNVTSSGNWTVGDGGYGLYLIGDGGTISATNNANMTLKEASVGIFGEESVNIVNNGDIIVGTTYLGADALAGLNPTHAPKEDTRNSVGMYAKHGASAVNTGTITVEHDHSVAAYVNSQDKDNTNEVATSFDNQGTINVDNGAVAMMAKGRYATAINSGTINMGNTLAACGAETVGMAAYDFAGIINTGTINANEGVGMYIATNATLDNQGIINVKNGTGIQMFGSGTIINEGTINMDVSGTGIAKDTEGTGPAVDGSVKIDNEGNITIGGKYVSIGGTLTANKPIVLDGAFVDIAHFDTAVPLFSAPDVSGMIHLTPNFAQIGNGYAYEIDHFTEALSAAGVSGKLTIETSPLFITKESGGSLLVAKKPYEDLVLRDPDAPIDGVKEASGDYTERQFVELYKGLDSILYQADAAGGDTKDSLILKQLDTYLEDIYTSTGSTEAFNNEAARTLAETRGDIYATVQTRMQNIQNAFDTSFNELLDSYNTTKDTGKFSVMYTKGDFNDDTIGIDDYDYNVTGLLYMKEYEGRNYGNKHGFTLGFAVSKFEFDDAPTTGKKSKEDVYSLRAGVHNVHNFNDYDSFRLVSKLELGYNRHEAKRSLELGDENGIKNYRNKGKYNTYAVTFDNRLEKTLYRSVSAKVDLYGGVDLEYGAIDNFTEKGDGLELKVKGNDYFSVQPNIGINAEKRVYIGKKISMKLFGDVNYAYEVGENYNSNKAKIKNGTEGYYELIRPEKEKGILTGRAGVTLEKANKAGITFDVEARDHQNKKDADIRYNARIKYVF